MVLEGRFTCELDQSGILPVARSIKKKANWQTNKDLTQQICLSSLHEEAGWIIHWVPINRICEIQGLTNSVSLILLRR